MLRFPCPKITRLSKRSVLCPEFPSSEIVPGGPIPPAAARSSLYGNTCIQHYITSRHLNSVLVL